MPSILTAMTFNIQQAIGRDNRRSLARTADVIRAEGGADAVALQEVAVHDGADQADGLAAALGWNAVTGSRDCVYDCGTGVDLPFGIALLTPHRVEAVERIPLTSEPDNPREVLRADLRTPGGTAAVFVVHPTAGDAAVRAAQTAEAEKAACAGPEVALLLGDLNSEPHEAPIAELASRYSFDTTDQPTWMHPAVEGREPVGQRLDYIVPVRGLTQVESRIVRSGASDHFPVLARHRR